MTIKVNERDEHYYEDPCDELSKQYDTLITLITLIAKLRDKIAWFKETDYDNDS